MTDRMAHEAAHEAWSAAQLVAFCAMNAQDRLSAVKSGALDHWTDEARNAALDVLGEDGKADRVPETPQALRFEPALMLLPRHPTRSMRLDRTIAISMTGWTLIMTAAAGRAYGLY